MKLSRISLVCIPVHPASGLSIASMRLVASKSNRRVSRVQALALLQQGQEAAADEVLAALGCSLRLSLHMLQPPGAPSAAASRPHAPAFQPELAPLVFENVVPGVPRGDWPQLCRMA